VRATLALFLVASPDDGATWHRTLLARGFRVRAIGGGRGGEVYVLPEHGSMVVSRDGGARFVPAPAVPVALFDRRTWRDGPAVLPRYPEQYRRNPRPQAPVASESRS
jgi:hypothetical protein